MEHSGPVTPGNRAVDYGALPPDINSRRMYAGPGAGPLLAAAQAWGALGAELHGAAASYRAVIAALTDGAWSGPAAASMAAAVTRYAGWLGATAGRAEHAADQSTAAAAAYEAAFAMTVPPAVVADNRTQLARLIATNTFGQNAARIAVIDAGYASMWAQDAVAMNGYAAASASATHLTRFTDPPSTANRAEATRSASAVNTLAAGASSAGASETPSSPSGLLDELKKYEAAFLRTWMTPYFFGGVGEKLSGITKGATPVAQAIEGVAAAEAPGLFGVRSVTGIGGGVPVAAGIGQASPMGRLSIPPSWAAATQVTTAPTSSLPASAVADAAHHAPTGALRGLPLAAGGRRSEGFAHHYGMRLRVMRRPVEVG